MAILGLGTDIVEITRIEAVVERSGDRLAKRFAVKEAAAKALGTGIRNGLAFEQFEVINDPLGKPRLIFHDRAAQMVEELGEAVHVMLADERR